MSVSLVFRATLARRPPARVGARPARTGISVLLVRGVGFPGGARRRGGGGGPRARPRRRPSAPWPRGRGAREDDWAPAPAPPPGRLGIPNQQGGVRRRGRARRGPPSAR